MSFSVVILAAGLGQRMHSSLPKVLHTLAGVPLLERIILTVKKLNPLQIIVVYGHKGDQLKKALQHQSDIIWVEQLDQRGTGHAVLQALPQLNSDKVLILNGDVPLISEDTLKQFLESSTNSNALNLITAFVDKPQGLGRIVRDAAGQFLRVVEEKDASRDEKDIREINTGIWYLSKKDLDAWLPKLTPHNAQQEYYLPDILKFAFLEKRPVVTFFPQSLWEVLGVNDQNELAYLERHLQEQQAQQLMKSGVRLYDPKRFDLRGEIKAGQNVEIDVNVVMVGSIVLGNRVKIGPNVMITDSILHDDVQILANSVIEGAVIGKGSKIGPFARIRPETKLAANVHIGNFVELKKAVVDEKSKINHLSYVGDATIGKEVNVGAGTITCNYDGAHKHPTIIEDNVFIGSDTQLVAPVTVGKGATIGAGTTVTKDVPPDSLIHNRIEHRVVHSWEKDKSGNTQKE
jgi:bifunctional UDP-N-acetylglucosamine pyrophosphorylase/glucosamine-1-phosphate N-acetyltransferase